jgi:hypothetical protein
MRAALVTVTATFTRRSSRPIAVLTSAFVGLAVSSAPAASGGATVADKRAEAARIQSRIDAQAERIAAADRALRLARSDREDADAEVRAAEAHLGAAEQALRAARTRLVERAVDAYVHGGRVSLVEHLTDSDGADLELRRHYVDATVRHDRDAIDVWEHTKEQLERARGRLHEARDAAQQAVAQLQADRDELAGQEAAQRSNLRRIQGELGALVRERQQRDLTEALRRRQPPSQARPVNLSPGTTTTTRPSPPPPDLGGIWACIREKESGNNYRAPRGGAYQFQQATWESLGGTGRPEDAPPELQDTMAIELQQRSGWGQWSTAEACGAY